MSATLKPRLDPLLWAQLRPSVISARKAGGEDASQTFSAGNVPLVPENRIATSLRVVLHDTKSVMEQFSDKLNHLLCDVDKTRRQIDKTNDNFENAHEKVLEELVATVNRCQKGLLEVLDTPAQASVLNEVKVSQMETVKNLEQLGTRVDLVQNSLQSILEQQGQILTCLSSLTPMAAPLQDVPHQLHHIASHLSLMEPLYQSLPDQLKLAQHETSKQNIQAIHDAFSAAFSTSMEKTVESLSHVISESVKLITTAMAGKVNNPHEPTMGQNHDGATELELRSRPNHPRQDMNTNANPNSPMMTLRPQGGQGGIDTNSSLGESGDLTSCPSGPRETRNNQESERARLVNPTARNKTVKRTSMTKRKSNNAIHSSTSTINKAKFAAKETNPKTRKVPQAVKTSDRVLRPRGCQYETVTLSGRRDQAAPLLKEPISSVNSTNKLSDPPFARDHRGFPPVVKAPPVPRRRMILPSLSDSDQQMDFEIDWGQI